MTSVALSQHDIAVVDSSVALKWVVDEPGSDDAVGLLDKREAGGLLLVAPEHLVGEVANGLRKRVAQRVISVADARTALDAIRDVQLEFIGGADRWFRSFDAAVEWKVTSYDAHFVLLAADLDAKLVTADRRLLDTAAAHALPVVDLTAVS